MVSLGSNVLKWTRCLKPFAGLPGSGFGESPCCVRLIDGLNCKPDQTT
jgi:hypothetical protein